MKELPADFWEKHSKAMESWQESGRMFYRLSGPLCKTFLVNEFVYYEFEKPFHAIVRSVDNNTAVLEVVKDHVMASPLGGLGNAIGCAEFLNELTELRMQSRVIL